MDRRTFLKAVGMTMLGPSAIVVSPIEGSDPVDVLLQEVGRAASAGHRAAMEGSGLRVNAIIIDDPVVCVNGKPAIGYCDLESFKVMAQGHKVKL